MRRITLALLIGIVANDSALSLNAQTPPAPTFRAGTTLIEFTIVALDDKGQPVTDLTKEEIVVAEEGQGRQVEFFRFDGEPSQPSSRVLPPGRFTNRFETAPNAARHITAILVDAMNTYTVKQGTFLFTQASIRTQILAYLDGLPPHTRVGVFRLGRRTVDVVHDLTDDVESLRARVGRMDLVMPELFGTPGFRPIDAPPSGASGSSTMATARGESAAADAKATAYYNENVQTNRVDLTLPGLEALGNHLARFPGRKNIVWVGNGMPLRIGGRRNPSRDYEARMRATAERLATQAIAIYPVASSLADDNIRDSLDLFAGVTGGRVTLTMNDPLEGLKTTALDQRGIYSIGFYAVAPPDIKWHPITVQVKRAGVTVTHRQGYLAEAPAALPLEWGEEQWRSVLANPLGSSVVRIDGQFEPASGAAPGTFDLRLQIALDDLHFRDAGGKRVADVEIVTAEKVASGDFAFRVERASLGAPASGAPGATASYTRRWALRPGTATVRVIVRDRFTSRFGTLDMPIRK